jgi:hypothetical protein
MKKNIKNKLSYSDTRWPLFDCSSSHVTVFVLACNNIYSVLISSYSFVYYGLGMNSIQLQHAKSTLKTSFYVQIVVGRYQRSSVEPAASISGIQGLKVNM